MRGRQFQQRSCRDRRARFLRETNRCPLSRRCSSHSRWEPRCVNRCTWNPGRRSRKSYPHQDQSGPRPRRVRKSHCTHVRCRYRRLQVLGPNRWNLLSRCAGCRPPRPALSGILALRRRDLPWFACNARRPRPLLRGREERLWWLSIQRPYPAPAGRPVPAAAVVPQ